MEDLQIALLENAYDFLEAAIDQLLEKDQSTKQLKYAILHLSSAIELMLKQRLYNEHWTLIFADINKANKAALISGNFRSVYFDEAVKRLEDICEVDLNAHKSVLTTLRTKRNTLEHYHALISYNESMSVLTKTWSFVLEFVASDLSDISSTQTDVQFDIIRQKIGMVQEIVNARLQKLEVELQAEIMGNELIVDCPVCLQTTVHVNSDDTECLFCKRRFSENSFPDEWLLAFSKSRFLSPKEQAMEPELQICSECGSETLYQFGGDNTLPEVEFGCLTCGRHWDRYESGMCLRCGSPYRITHLDEDTGMCDECIDAMINRE